jgi:hypothetical protein
VKAYLARRNEKTPAPRIKVSEKDGVTQIRNGDRPDLLVVLPNAAPTAL